MTFSVETVSAGGTYGKKRFVDACVFHLQNLGHSDSVQYTIEHQATIR
jgi:hypothetical protein